MLTKKQEQNLWEWSHYLPLTGVVFLAHYYSEFLETMVVNNNPWGWPLLFIWYAAWLGVGDRIIHWFYKNVLKKEI